MPCAALLFLCCRPNGKKRHSAVPQQNTPRSVSSPSGHWTADTAIQPRVRSPARRSTLWYSGALALWPPCLIGPPWEPVSVAPSDSGTGSWSAPPSFLLHARRQNRQSSLSPHAWPDSRPIARCLPSTTAFTSARFLFFTTTTITTTLDLAVARPAGRRLRVRAAADFFFFLPLSIRVAPPVEHVAFFGNTTTTTTTTLIPRLCHHPYYT